MENPEGYVQQTLDDADQRAGPTSESALRRQRKKRAKARDALEDDDLDVWNLTRKFPAETGKFYSFLADGRPKFIDVATLPHYHDHDERGVLVLCDGLLVFFRAPRRLAAPEKDAEIVGNVAARMAPVCAPNVG